jgi:hypothetical protein
MIDMGNDGHISNVPLLVHQTTNFIDSKINLYEDLIICFFCLIELTMIGFPF